MSEKSTSSKKSVKTLEKENQTLRSYLATVNDLYWASQTIASADNLLYELNQLLYKVMGAVGAKDGSISRLDQDTDELVFVLVHGELGRQLPDYRIKSDTGIAGWVVANRRPIIVNDPRQDKRFSQAVDKEFGFFTNSILSVPMMRRGNLTGVVQLLNKQGAEFNDDDAVLLLILGQVSAIAFEALDKQGGGLADDPFAPL